MKKSLLAVLPLVLSFAVGCATPDQRYFYRKAIEEFTPRIPSAGTRCWLTPDLTGPQSGSNAIAEEEFTNYLVEKGLCTVVEKHPDAIGGYNWPTSDVCPCSSGVTPCSAACSGGGAAAALPSIGGFGGGGGGGGGNDNDRSTDKLLERYKKRQLAQKLIVYRIDELKQTSCTIWFRVSDARTAAVEVAQTITIEKESAPARAR